MKLQGQLGAMPRTLTVYYMLYLAKTLQDPLRIREIDSTFGCGHGKVTLRNVYKMGNTVPSPFKTRFPKRGNF